MSKDIISLENEIWKPVVGWEGLYEVSNMGRVISLKRHRSNPTQLLKPQPKRVGTGYFKVVLFRCERRRSCSVHRLVAEAFLGPSDLHVNHKDLDGTNNQLSNLEYVTHRENTIHYLKATGKYKGYTQLPSGKFRAVLIFKAITYNLGAYNTKEECISATSDAFDELSAGIFIINDFKRKRGLNVRYRARRSNKE